MLTGFFPYLILLSLVVFLFSPRFKSIFAAIVIARGAVLAIGSGLETIRTGTADLYLQGLDPLAAVFLLAIAVNGIASSLYAIGYVKRHAVEKTNIQLSLHFMAMIVLFYSMIGVVTAQGAYQFLLYWELMTISSFLLVLFDSRQKEVLHAAVSYFILMHIGFFLLVGAFSSGPGTAFFGDGTLSFPVFILFLFGFGLKAGIFPLHTWLPVAHPAAPSHVSAMMSGVMIKMGIYGILRCLFALPEELLYAGGLTVFALGGISALFGIIRAAVQTNLKRLLAYSSIENIGIICMGLGFGAVGRSMGIDLVAYAGFGAALIHVLGHSHYKTILYLGAGSVQTAAHTTDINRLGGLLKRMPVSGAIFGVAVLAICAVPPLVGFASEYILLDGMFRAIAARETIVLAIVGVVILALVGGLTVMAMAKAFGITFLGNPRSCAARESTEVPLIMQIATVLPLAGIIAGPLLYGHLILDNADTIFSVHYYSAPSLRALEWIELVGGILIGVIGLLWGLKVWMTRRSGIPPVIRPTWGCAFTAPNKKMQYTASSFNRDLQQAFKREESEDIFREDELFPEPHTVRNEETDSTAKAVTHYLSMWLHRFTARLALFQTGKTNHYILHALVFLLIVLLLSVAGFI